MELVDALPEPVRLTHPIAARIPFDHDSPPEVIKPVVQAEIVAAMAYGSPVDQHHNPRGAGHATPADVCAGCPAVLLQEGVAREAADTDESGRLRFEPDSSSHSVRVVIAASPERHDRRAGLRPIEPCSPTGSSPEAGARRGVRSGGPVRRVGYSRARNGRR